jgi:WhiB family transcriptional regulator, redox-sensing transcriptional regulator
VGDVGALFDLMARSPAWHRDAACREHPEVDFFAVRSPAQRPAKRVCAGCIVLDECRAWAMAQHDLDGIWGGLSVRDRDWLRGMGWGVSR